MVKKVEIARALGVSPAAVSKYIKRGMPTTSAAAARAWRDANLDPVRRVAQEWGLNAKRSGGGPGARPPSHLVAHANELGRLAKDDFSRYEHALREALKAARPLPESVRELVRLDETVWDQLLGVEGPADGLGEISLGHFDGDSPEMMERLWACVCADGPLP